MKKLNELLKTALYIVIVVSIGLFAINLGLEYNYKSQFLNGPCSLCAEQNEDQATCVEDCFTEKVDTYNRQPIIDYTKIKLE